MPASASSPAVPVPAAAPAAPAWEGGVFAPMALEPATGLPLGALGAAVPAAAICVVPLFGAPAPGAVAESPEGVVGGIAALPAVGFAVASVAVRGGAPVVPGRGFPPLTGGSRSGLMQPARQSAPAHSSRPSMWAVFFMSFRSMLTRASMISEPSSVSSRAPRARRLTEMYGRPRTGAQVVESPLTSRLAMRDPCQKSGRWVGPGQAAP